MWWFIFGGMILCVVLLPIFLAERWCRRHRQKKYFPMPRGMGWLQRTAVWILYHLPPTVRDRLNGSAAMAADRLRPGMKREKFCRDHQVRKLMIIYGGMMMTVVFLFLYALLNRPSDLADRRLEREDARGDSRTVDVEAEIEGFEGRHQLTLEVNPRKYSDTEIGNLMEQVKAYIDRVLPGENEDLQNIESSLYFPDAYPGENITIEWQPQDYNLIHQDGSLGDLTMYQLPAETAVTAVIRYDDSEMSYEKTLWVTGREKSAEERLEEELLMAVAAADAASSGSDEMILPREVDGHAVSWYYLRKSDLPLLVLLFICLLVSLVFYQDERLKHTMQRRTDQLLYAYPGFVHRMVLMLGAGMTVRRCWDQLAKEYEKDDKTYTQDWLGREMKYACIQMQSGTPEIQAYMDFGRRTELPQYMKFSQLLMQYIRRGSRGMQEMMLQEAYEAEKQRRDTARRLGEMAGTRLLLPMILLLIIVLLIIMVPAFLSM